jgi:hypothetical protein
MNRVYDAAVDGVELLLDTVPSSSVGRAVAAYAERWASRADAAARALRHRCQSAGVAPEHLDLVCGTHHEKVDDEASHAARDPETAPRDARMPGVPISCVGTLTPRSTWLGFIPLEEPASAQRTRYMYT